METKANLSNYEISRTSIWEKCITLCMKAEIRQIDRKRRFSCYTDELYKAMIECSQLEMLYQYFIPTGVRIVPDDNTLIRMAEDQYEATLLFGIQTASRLGRYNESLFNHDLAPLADLQEIWIPLA